MSLLVRQCDIGPRAPGSKGHLEVRELIKGLARESGYQASELCFTIGNPMGDDQLDLCNLVVIAGSGPGPALWLGAHYDTRPVADKDPDPERRGQPLVGANDGASGVAVLLHLLELFAQQPPPRPVALLFLDGEDSGRPGKAREFCLGSSHLARTWQDFGNPLSRIAPEGVIILDMIGDADLDIPQEGYSKVYSPDLLARVYARAYELQLPAFISASGPAVYDDHIPFIQAGLPAIDLIDFDYPQWHTLADTPEACSASSLEQVGTLVTDLIYRP